MSKSVMPATTHRDARGRASVRVLRRAVARSATLAGAAALTAAVVATGVAASPVSQPSVTEPATEQVAMLTGSSPAAEPATDVQQRFGVSPRADSGAGSAATEAREGRTARRAEAVSRSGARDASPRPKPSRARPGQRVERIPAPPVPQDPRDVARGLLPSYGFSADQFDCLDSLWVKESGWDVHADNPTSSAYGIPQALPGSKMATAGADWADNPATQIRWGLGYIRDVYGSPCEAWSHSQAMNWY